MANEPLQGPSLTPVPGNGLGGMRTAGVRPCPSCNTSINVHATVCPNCGEHVATKEKSVRCRRCRRRASSNLVVCPHCGRELQPATTRWLTWGVPLLVLLFLAGLLLVRLSRGNPAQWAQAQGERVAGLVASLSSRLQPEFSVAMIPPGQDPDDPLVSQAMQAGAQAEVSVVSPPDVLEVAVKPGDAALPAPPATNADPATTDVVATLPPTAQEPAVAAAETPTLAATATAPTATEPTVTAPPTATATAVSTPTTVATPTLAAAAATTPTLSTTLAAAPTLAATATPAATATISPVVSLLGLLTPTPVTPSTPAVLEVYAVQSRDTLFDIASAYDLTVEDLLLANNLTEDDVYTIQPGDELIIPAPTPAGAPTATPALAPAIYTVRAGDTIVEIALRLDLTMEELLAANDMTLNEARSLQPGDVLALPGGEPTPAPTALATPTLAATPTVAATATVVPSPTVAPSPTLSPTAEVTLRLDTPRLRSPENGNAVSCGGQGTLNWLAVPSTRATDLYLVHLGYVNSIGADGVEEIIWVITQQRPAGTTSWPLDNDLCGLAPVTEGKQWRWYVEVAEKTSEGLQPVSPASSVWGFAWQ